MQDKFYYLDTNALYSLINKLAEIKRKTYVFTSIYALEEIFAGINEKEFFKRKSIIKKVEDMNLCIVKIHPIECIAKSFGINVSENSNFKKNKEMISLYKKVIIDSCSYKEFHEKMLIEGVDLKKSIISEDNLKVKIKDMLDLDIKRRYCEVKKVSNEKQTIVVNDLNKYIFPNNNTPKMMFERSILLSILNILNISFEDEDIERYIMKCDRKSLSAFHIGQIGYLILKTSNYNENDTKNMHGISFCQKNAEKNDIKDLFHLLYLRDENFVIVSSDNIFSHIVYNKMRISNEDFAMLFTKV